MHKLPKSLEITWGKFTFFALGLCAFGAQAAWYDNPSVKALIDTGCAKAYTYGINLSEDGQYLMVNLGASDDTKPVQLYRMEDLLAAKGAAKVVYGETLGKNLFGTGGNGWKAGAISSTLGLMIPGSGLNSGSLYTSLEIPATAWTKDSNAFQVTGDLGGAGSDGMDFNAAGTRLYANRRDSTSIFVYDTASLKTGHSLSLTKTITDTGVSRIRSLNCYTIGGKDLVYYGEGEGGGKVCVYDASADSVTTIQIPEANGDIAAVKLSGATTSSPKMHVLVDSGKLVIYTLTVNGTEKTAVPAVVIEGDALARLADFDTLPTGITPIYSAFEVTDDGDTAFLIAHVSNGNVNPKLTVITTEAATSDCIISMNMAGGNGTDELTSPVSGFKRIGVRPVYANYWFNNPNSKANGATGFVDQYGASIPGVSVTTKGANNWTTGHADGGLLYGFLDDGNNTDSTPPSITFDGLTEANNFGSTCTVYVYMSTDNASRKFYAPTVNGTRYTFKNGATVEGSDDWGDANLGANTGSADYCKTVVGWNVLKIENVAIDNGKVTITSGRTDAKVQRGSIAAVQIVATRTATVPVSLSVNFNGECSGDTSGCPISGSAGIEPSDKWINISGTSVSDQGDLVWSDGEIRSGATLSASADHNWCTSQNKGSTNIFYGYMDDTDVSATVDGLTTANGFPATCTVYVYLSTDNASRTLYAFSLNGTRYTSDGTGVGVEGTADWGDSAYAVAGNAVLGKNVLKCENVSLANGQVKIVSGRTSGTVGRGGLAAFQIVIDKKTAADPVVPFQGDLTSTGTFSVATWTPARSNAAWSDSANRDAYLCVADTGAATLTMDEEISLKSLKLMGSGDLTLEWPGISMNNIKLIDFSTHTGIQRLTADPDVPVTAGAATYLPNNYPTDITIPSGASVVLDNVTWSLSGGNAQVGTVALTNNGVIAVSGANASFGNVRILAGTSGTLEATGGNKLYNVTGAGAASSTANLTSGQGWGTVSGSRFRNVRLATPAGCDFWADLTDANETRRMFCDDDADPTVTLDLGGTLHLVNSKASYTQCDYVVRALSGTGGIETGKASVNTSLRIKTQAGDDETYSGSIASGITVKILSGSAGAQHFAGTINGDIQNQGTVALTGAGCCKRTVSVGGNGSLIIDTTASLAAENISVTEGGLVVGTNANTTVTSLSFNEWASQTNDNFIRFDVDEATGKTGTLHVNAVVDCMRLKPTGMTLTKERDDIKLLTSSAGFTNVDKTEDAQHRALRVIKNGNVYELHYMVHRGGLCIVFR